MKQAELGMGTGIRVRVQKDILSVGVAQIAPTTDRFVRVNQKFGDINGYTTSEILALDFQSLATPTILKSSWLIWSVSEQGKSVNSRWRNASFIKTAEISGSS